MSKKDAELIKINTHYSLLDEDEFNIDFTVDADKKITISPAKGNSFIFRDSSPETVKAIANLLYKAAEAAEREEF